MRKILLSAFLLIVIYSCKKDDKLEQLNERDPEIILTEISSQLSNADSISIFTAALQNISLSKEEIAEGITVFAPLNSEGGQISSLHSKSASTFQSSVQPVLPDSVVRNHIVKGVHRLADLTDNKVLTGLNGKRLKIKRTGDTLWINGVIIGGKEIISNNDQVVYVVKMNLNDTSIDDYLLSDSVFANLLLETENEVATWQKNQVLLDAVLSQDAVIDSIPATFRITHREIANFQFGATTQPVVQMWQIGYQHIHKLNMLEKKAAGLVAKGKMQTARVKALRAYIYLQLLSYFGNIPFAVAGHANLTNTDRQSVYNYIVKELEAAEGSSMSGLNNQLNTSSIKALLAKAALLEKNYQKVLNYTNQIISSSNHSLSTNLASSWSSPSEIIWSNSGNMNPAIKSFFYDRDNLAYLRITEIYLMNTEANLALGNVQQAQASLMPILQRRGMAGAAINMNTLRTVWGLEMKREGRSFINLIRWGTASDVLAPKGFLPKHKLLPIPMTVLMLNRGMVQNPGY